MEPENMNDSPLPKKKEKKKEVPLQTNEQLVELIKDALIVQSRRQSQKRKTHDELEAMVSTCEEFMSSFIILGYDFSGNHVDPIIVAHNQQESDSLGAYLQKFINAQFQRPS